MSGEFRYFALGLGSAMLLPLFGMGLLQGYQIYHSRGGEIVSTGTESMTPPMSTPVLHSSGSEGHDQTIAEGSDSIVSGEAEPAILSGDTLLEESSSDLTPMVDTGSLLRDEIERAAWMMRVRSASGVLFPDFGMMLTEYDAQRGSMTDDQMQGYDRRMTPYREYLSEIRAADRSRRTPWRAAVIAELPDLSSRPSPYPAIYSLIEIDISEQKLYAYEDGELIMVTPITSGKRGYGTIQGMFEVGRKQTKKLLISPFSDDPYRLWVDYWIPFSGAYGIHDTCNSKNCWRTQFGGMDYTTRGSHGCVNTPYEGVRFLYEWAVSRTSVYVHQ